MNEQELKALQDKAQREAMMFRWLRLHPDFSPCDANCQLVDDFLAQNQLSFTDENLTVAFQALDAGGQLVKQRPTTVKPVQPAPATSAESVEASLDELYPLPSGWAKVYTAKDVHNLSGDEYRRMYHSAKGDVFRKRVNEIMRREGVRTNQYGARL